MRIKEEEGSHKKRLKEKVSRRKPATARESSGTVRKSNQSQHGENVMLLKNRGEENCTSASGYKRLGWDVTKGSSERDYSDAYREEMKEFRVGEMLKLFGGDRDGVRSVQQPSNISQAEGRKGGKLKKIEKTIEMGM